MRDYGKITPAFWIGRTGRALRGDPHAQLVAAYLLTAPQSSMIGVYYCPIATISNDIGIPFEGASKGLRRGVDEGFCTFDDETDWVWVHEMARFQIADRLKPTDNMVKSIARDFEKLPETFLKQGFYNRYREPFHLPEWHPIRPNSPSPSEGPSKPLRSQEQEQEQEQEKNPIQGGANLSGRGTAGTDGKRHRLAVVNGPSYDSEEIGF